MEIVHNLIRRGRGVGRYVTHFRLDNGWTFSAAAIGYGYHHLAAWPTNAKWGEDGTRAGFEHLMFEASQDELLKHMAEIAARPVVIAKQEA
jgi:hypothetical protein